MIEYIRLKNLTAFKNFEWKATGALNGKDAGALNVIVGINDTGKTHLLKFLYAFAKSYEGHSKGGIGSGSWAKLLADKLLKVFLPHADALNSLISNGAPRLDSYIRFNDENLHFSFGKDTTSTITDCESYIKPDKELRVLFFPPKEVLTTHQALTALLQDSDYQSWGFDATYYDLIDALRRPGAKGNVNKSLTDSKVKLEELLNGHFEYINDNEFLFYRTGAKEPSRMWQTAEGYKRIGILTLLVNSRWIRKGSILFFDEPEANLHPMAARVMAQILFNFAQAGVQIFLSTHSYFILKQLELLARKEDFSIPTCSLVKGASGIEAIFANLKNGMPENSIVDESVAMFEEDLQLELE